MSKCEYLFDGGAPYVRCDNEPARQVYIGTPPDWKLMWRCRDHGGVRTMIEVGQYINTERFPLDKVMDAYDREGNPQETHERLFTLAELFSSEDLKHPDKCVLSLVTQLTSCGTNGSLQTRALVIIKERPPALTTSERGPYR